MGSRGQWWESFTSKSHLPDLMVMGKAGGKRNDDFSSRIAGALGAGQLRCLNTRLIISLNWGPGLWFAAAMNSACFYPLAWSRRKAEVTQNAKVYWFQLSPVHYTAFSGRIEFNQPLKVSEAFFFPPKCLKIYLICCSSSLTSFPVAGKMNVIPFWSSLLWL